MKELNLNEIKAIEFRILRHFDEFCRKNGIRYYLSNGTLLGAVKYKGFIPWDDDIDVLVPREDYNKLFSLYCDTKRYRLVTSEKENRYIFPYAKLSDEETLVDNGSKVQMGLSIDIFPLDYFPDDRKVSVKLIRKCRFQLSMLCLSIAGFHPGRNILRTCVKYAATVIAKLIGKRVLKAALNSTQEKICKKSGKLFLGCVAWPVYGEREVIPAEVFSDVVNIEFEGEVFPAPAGYDTYLRSLYGDYKLDPPVEKQKSHHSFKAYKLK